MLTPECWDHNHRKPLPLSAPAHSDTEFVTVDTEFMRERTYWPKLCLVQLGGPVDTVAVDPLAKGIDLAPLFELMANRKVLKVFHAARQDVEIFFNLTGKVPAPIFDTQVAAMVCGFVAIPASYETLAGQLVLNAKIDKSSRFTDWSHRPADRQANRIRARRCHSFAQGSMCGCAICCRNPAAPNGSAKKWPS